MSLRLGPCPTHPPHPTVPPVPPSCSPAAGSLLALETWDEDRVEARLKSLARDVGGAADLAFLFITPAWRAHLPEFLELAQITLRCPHIIGCSTSGLVGTGTEHEDVEGFSLLALRAPRLGVRIESWPADPRAWPAEPVPSRGAVLLGHPLRLPVDGWLGAWRELYPELPAYGGLAAGGQHPAGFLLFDQSGIREDALLAVHLAGGLALRGTVAQSCLPIGQPYTITGAEGNVVTSLGGVSPMQRLEEAFDAYREGRGLPEDLPPGLLHAGFPANERHPGNGGEDYVVRAIIGADPSSGAMALAALPRVGQTMQFHLRDAEEADARWRRACQLALPSGTGPLAALLFPCLGRGQAFFEQPDHDAGLLAEALGPVPAAGAFVNGELGLTRGHLHAHAFSASAALIVPDAGGS